MLGFNSLISQIIPFFPKWFVRPFANPYVAGESLDEAIGAVRKLNAEGFSVTIDILGEFVTSNKEANQIQDEYLKVIQQISDNKLDRTISVKLTHLGYELNDTLGEANILALTKKGKELGG